MALPPWSPVADGHRGGRPWRPWLSDAVSMMAKNDWFHGFGQCSLTAQGETLPHLGEEAVAGCEMLLNKVISRVTVRPVTHPPPSAIEEFTARASCYIWRILGLNFSFVWEGSLTWSLSACVWGGGGETADNNVLVWKGEHTYKSKSPKLLQSVDVSVPTVNHLMPMNCNWSFWLLTHQGINL